MNNEIITKTDNQFGTVRCIEENGTVLFCASDVAKALGYVNANKAVGTHCLAITKRYSTISGRRKQEINFIPECDVYRLICHSKLPDAIRFEKWVFEDVVPNAVHGKQNSEPEQLTLETAEYYFVPKTWRGEPVVTANDVAHFLGSSKRTYGYFIKSHCKESKDFFVLGGSALRAFKAENPSFSKMASAVIIVTQSGFKKLMKAYKTDVDIKKLFIESKTPALPEKSSGSVEISLDQKPREHGDIFEKYRSLGVYKQADVDKLVEEYGIFVNGQNCLPVSVAKKFFIPLAVSTVVAEINGGGRCLIKAEILNDEDPNESYLCTLKVLNRHGISEVVTTHNAFLTGEIKFYEKGKAPVK